MPGLFITFEGTEGSGKTTQVEMLGEWLSTHNPVVVREPGGTELGERVREVVLFAGLDIDAEAEMYLFMAGRRQLIAEVIAPALAAGQIVVADRYHDSTLAYQGGARGVPAIWPSTFPRPHITFLLEGPIVRTLFRLAAPNILNLAALSVIVTADAFFAGWLGPAALQAVTLVFPFKMLMQQMAASGMGGAVTAATARAIGADKLKKRAAIDANRECLSSGCG